MSEPNARLYLITPVLRDVGAFSAKLAEACAAGDVAAVMARALIVAAEGAFDLASVAARGGADGVHIEADLAVVRDLRERLKSDRALGVGAIRTRDEAMMLGEVGVDYLMFGEPRPDGFLPPLEKVIERASWWAEIFETPCVAFAPTIADVPKLAATGAEFVALGEAVWDDEAGPAAAIRDALSRLVPPRVTP
jgi:thiamine-phosphate pyrophosphorylase